MYDDPEKGPANLKVVPRRWVAFDWDDIAVPHNPDVVEYDQAEFANWAQPPALFNPEFGVRLALRRLPPAFRHVSCFWQVTGSAGFKEGFRLRTWHWLNQPLTGAQLKCWLNPAIERGLIDPCTLVEVQPHYIGCAIRGGPDPCPTRFGLLEQARHSVAVPDVASIKRRQAQVAIAKRVHDVNDGADAEHWIEDCVAALQRAGTGTRHHAYKTALARARALCDRRGIAWEPVLQRLRQAYESTLTDAEIRRRRKGSIDGLPDWIERRAS